MSSQLVSVKRVTIELRDAVISNPKKSETFLTGMGYLLNAVYCEEQTPEKWDKLCNLMATVARMMKED